MKTEFYKDKKGEHRWRVKSSNGKIVGASNEGFTRSRAAKRNLELMREALYQVIPGDWRLVDYSTHYALESEEATIEFHGADEETARAVMNSLNGTK